MSKLTKEQIKQYVNGGYNRCPYCYSTEIEAGSYEFDDNYAWAIVVCNDCNEEWNDIYTLTGISEVEL